MGKRILSVSICFLLVLSLVSGALPRAQAAQLDGHNLALSVDGRDPVTVKAYQSSYGNNLLLSLRDVAAAVCGRLPCDVSGSETRCPPAWLCGLSPAGNGVVLGGCHSPSV